MLPKEIEAKYEIRGTLGAGAMGTVYDAMDRLIERRVAVKVVRRPPPGDPEGEEAHARFRREAQAAGRLSHPNIVGVYDYGENAETAWIVMELVEGGSLKQRLDRQERFAVPDIVRLMEEVLAALAYSHGRGVVHRDIKPGNVMLTGDGTVKLADFGIARLENSSMTQVGTVIGTPSYMAPEQLRGETVDARADIWAAGVMLYQLLTGEKPFEGGFSAVMHKALHTEPPPPSQLSVTAPRALDAVVAKAMAKRPEDRYANALAFAEAIRAAGRAPAAEAGFSGGGSLPGLDPDATMVAGAAPPPRPAPPPAAAAATGGRKAPVALIAGAGGAIAVAAVAGWLVLGTGGKDATPPETAQQRQEEIRREAEQRAREEAERLQRQAAQDQQPRDAAAEADRQAQARQQAEADQQRQAQQQAEADRQAQAQQQAEADRQRQAQQQAEADRQRQAQQQAEADRQRQAQQQAEADRQRQAQQQAEADRQRQAQQQAEADRQRQAQQQAEADRQRQAQQQAEADRQRQAQQQAEADRQRQAQQQAEADRQRQAQQQAEADRQRQAQQQAEADRQRQAQEAQMRLRAELRTAAAAAAVAEPCSLVSWSVADDRATLSGIIRRGGEAALRNAFASRGIPAESVALQLQSFDGPYCEVLDVVRPVASLGAEAPPRARVLGTAPLAKGELLRMSVEMPDYPAQLYLAYFMKSGEVAQLVASRPEQARARIALGDPAPGFPGWEVDEPFGTDMMILFASDRPIFQQRRPAVEKQGDYLAALGTRLRAMQQQGARISARVLLVDTVEKR